MKVTNKIDIHLDDLRHIPPINVMQADAYTRVLEFSLYSGGQAWNVPEGVDVAVAYIGSSGKGIYDTLPDGAAACTVNGNVVTAVVAPQAVAMDGNTNLNIIFTDGEGHQLAAFCVTLKVERNPAVNATKPPDYINLRQWLSKEIRELLTYYVHVEPGGGGSYFTDSVMDDVLQACASDATVMCRLELPMEPENLQLPLAKHDDSTAYFSAVFEGKEYLVTINADGVTVEQSEVGSGGAGTPGEDGGYYTPTVTDNGDGTMTVSFAASNADMPALDPATVVLPEGPAGYSPTANVEQTEGGAIIHIFDKDGHTFVVVENGKDGDDGAPGADGNGIKSAVLNADYTLTLTFDDGTSYTTPSIRGATGPKGEKGNDGNTSVLVMTKAEYSELTAAAVAQFYVDGIRLIVVEDGYTNLVPKATDAAGNVYRGCGYLDGYRMTSSGSLSAQAHTCVSGFMPYTHGSIIRVVGSCGGTLSDGGQYIGLYDANHEIVKIEYASAVTGATWEPRADGLFEMTIDTGKMSAWSGAKYFRVSCVMCVGADLIVTINEPIGLEV